MAEDANRTYHALTIPSDALEKGGAEILRAGLVDEELSVAALRAFDDPAVWGEVLADIAHKIALMFSAEDAGLTEQDALTQIAEAFVADIGPPAARDVPSARKRSPAKKKPAGRAAKAKKPAVRKAAPKKAAARKTSGAAKRKKR